MRQWVIDLLARHWRDRVPQREQGKWYGVDQTTISKYRKGKTLPEVDVLAEMCKREHVSPAWLLLEVGPESLDELRDLSVTAATDAASVEARADAARDEFRVRGEESPRPQPAPVRKRKRQ